MARKISVSFKETKRDLELYEKLMAMDDKGYWIKEVLRNALKDVQIENKTEKTGQKDCNIMDF